MKHFFLALLFFTILFSPSVAQDPVREDEDVVKITTSLIQLDVSVTDSKGRIIRDIKSDEIEIYQDGKKQTISGFKFVSAVNEDDVESKLKPDKYAPEVPTPPTKLRNENVRRTIAIVIDDLTLSWESAYYTKRAVKRFIDEQMQTGDLVAIIRAGSGVGALQQFTSDKRILYAAAERIRWNPVGGGGISAFAPLSPSMSQTAAALGDETVTEEDIEDERNRENSQEDFRASAFVTGTLGAIDYVVGGMKDLPGRKSVILFSDGFRLIERDRFGNQNTGQVFSQIRRLIDEANRNSVVFYTLDARGLQYTGLTAADDASMLSGAAIGSVQSNRSEQLFETQAGLSFLAEETGGIAIKNNNDLIGGMRKILNDQSYYLISYEPDDETFDTVRKFKKLEVKVSRPGTNVRYRSGFINSADDEKRDVIAANVQQNIPDALISPFAINDIEIKLNPLFGYDATQGSFIRSLIHIDTRDMQFIKNDKGDEEIKFSVVAVIFGDNGTMIDSHQAQYTVSLSTQKVASLKKDGLVYNFVFPMKKPGAFQYRVALKDENSGKIGTANEFIEIPNLKKKGAQISGITLEGFSPQDWQKFVADPQAILEQKRDPAGDTSRRMFKQGSVLYYNYGVYNVPQKTESNVFTKVRLFRENKIVLDGSEQKLATIGTGQRIQRAGTGALNIDKGLLVGDYILQVLVIDKTNAKKPKITTRFVEFEVTQ